MSSLVPILVASLYYLAFAFLLGLVALLAVAPRNSSDRKTRRAGMPWSPVIPAPAPRNGRAAQSLFFPLALSLLLWQLTLFWEARTTQPELQLGLGRVNFAAVSLAVYLAYRFVQEVALPSSPLPSPAWSCWLLTFLRIEAAALTLLTLLTPLVDEAESVVGGHPVTHFGPLFPLYLLHVLGYLAAALLTAFRARRRTTVPSWRGQLRLIGSGTLATGGVSLFTNALLPYGYGDFRFCHVGTLSTFFFLLAVAYAVFAHGLFELRLVVRATLVYGILLTLVLGAYGSAVFVTTQYLTGAAGADKLTQFVVLLIAFSFDPLRRFLEEKADGLLFTQNNRRTRNQRNLIRGYRLISSLLPWHRG